MSDDDLDTFGDLIEFPSVPEKKAPSQIDVGEMDIEDESSLGDILHSFGMLKKSTGQQLTKPWMKFHRFVRVKTVDEVRDIVDRALQNGFCALDLETEGFDNRIDYTESGQPYTRHRIVGFCLSVKGVGYYIPVRHSFEPEEESDPNVPVEGVEAEIRRLCLASQPKLTPEGLEEDPLGSRKIEIPPRVIIAFWHSKFDQEFLYPITGIDAWHPHSFEDGYLAAYTLYTDDKALGLKDKAEQKLRIQDPEERGPDGKPVWHAYEMIHFDDLFLKGMKKSEKRFQDLRPDENSDVVRYGCSDGICTELLCEQRKVAWELTKEGVVYEYDNVIGPVQVNKFKDIYRLEKQTVQAVRVLERARAKIDRQEITTLLEEARKERLEYEEKIVSFASNKGFKNFNPGSPQQLSDFLFTKKGLDITPKPAENKTPGQYKTDAKTLEKLFESKPDVEVLSWVVKYRQVDKIIGTYLESLANNCDEDSCLRFQFKQTGAATGRFTAPAGDPEHGYAGIPPQGIPVKVDPKRPKVANSLRRMFVARDGYTLVKIDYAGQELRIVANLSGEPVWIDEFLHGDGDLHTITARAFFGNHITKENKTERNMGKIANFALIYGGGVQAVQRATKCDEAEAARKKASFDQSVPIFAKWVKRQHAYVKENLGVKTAFGRFISIPDAAVKEGNKVNGVLVDRKMVHKIRAACERKSTNYPIQGCICNSSLILTRRGQQKIGGLADSGEEFTVWTGTKWAQATACDMGPCERAEISLKDGTLIECDTRHKLLIVLGTGYQWVDYSDLEVGMPVATPLCEPLDLIGSSLPRVPRGQGRPFKVPDDLREFWYWMGRYVGDGYLDQRGGICFCFGGHERQDVLRCKKFWEKAGLNPRESSATHTPHVKASTRYQVDVWSVDLINWLLLLGFKKGVTAHTKRLPDRIFCETLEHRRSFLCGVMDSDGHKPRLPEKVEGVWEKNKKGNPYNVHLCQRDLLVDLKRLFRTVGVESTIRGPYRSGRTKTGAAATSYRLDLNRRMFERNVILRTDVRHPKFSDMNAPQFLVDEFLSFGPWTPKDFEDDSSYVLYLRLKTGGRVSVYTLQFLCRMLKVQLRQPIYGFKRLVSKTALGRKEHTYTLSVQDPLHRFESDGVVTKNSGADILKISLVLLLREFHKRKWLRNGGDDSVRMILTVHDEIVFEIQHDRLQQAVPVIASIMESPSSIARGWKVPLVVEPLLGKTWDAKYDWDKILAGKAPVPDWLQGHLVPGAARDKLQKPQPQSTVETPPIKETLPEQPKNPSKVAPTVSASTVAAPPNEAAVEFRIPYSLMTRESVLAVRYAIREADPTLTEGSARTLKLSDSNGNLLIRPEDGIVVDPRRFSLELRLRNLGPGRYQS